MRITVIRCVVTELEKELLRKDEIIRQQAEEIRLLREKVDLLVGKLFGRKSEQLDSSQLELLLDPETAKKPEETAGNADDPAVEDLTICHKLKPTNRNPGKPRLPEHLPVEETVLDPEPVKANPGAYRRIGQEISEQLDYRPGRFLRKRTIRRKYVSLIHRERPPLIAALAPGLQEGCLATPGLIAEILCNKYTNHLPFYRQQADFKKRHRVEVSRQTMINWEALAADWLKPLYHLLRQDLLSSESLQIDETCIRYLSKGSGRAQHGYLWAYRSGKDTLVFDWQTSRSHRCLENVLAPCYQGVIQSDGYRGYETYARSHPDIELAACWAHVRRKFYEARDYQPRLCGWILRQIGLLYAVERHLRHNRAGPKMRAWFRQSQSRLIYQRLGKALIRLQSRFLPQSSLGKAIRYALELWPRLGVYLDNGKVEIDNNRIENAIRPTAIGKKNWLFFGSPGSGWKAAIFYTLIENCRSLGIDSYAYLKDVLERLPHMTNHQVATLLPGNWHKEHKDQQAKLTQAS